MSDLIRRRDAIDALRVAYRDDNIQSAKDDPCIVDAMTDWAIRQVKALPSAQSDVIKCENCNHRGEKPISDGRYWCSIHMAYMYYCSDAERRTDGNGRD